MVANNKFNTTQHFMTLFLDRDGVINHRIIGGYVTHYSQFVFNDGVLPALKIFAQHFERIVVVTNQQGIAKGLMTETDLHQIHTQMINDVTAAGGRIDAVYYCPHLATARCTCRKPQIGMAIQAQQQFSDIVFANSLMIGDSVSDLLFGRAAGMKTGFITNNQALPQPFDALWADEILPNLASFATQMQNF